MKLRSGGKEVGIGNSRLAAPSTAEPDWYSVSQQRHSIAFSVAPLPSMSVSKTITTSSHMCNCCASTFHTRIACHPEREATSFHEIHLHLPFDNIGNELRFRDVKTLEVTHIKVSNPSSATRTESETCYSMFPAEVAATTLLGHPMFRSAHSSFDVLSLVDSHSDTNSPSSRWPTDA